MYSDNGTNLVRVVNKLDKDLKLSIRDATEEVAKLIENDGTMYLEIYSTSYTTPWRNLGSWGEIHEDTPYIKTYI
jgi:hypothetical protein